MRLPILALSLLIFLPIIAQGSDEAALLKAILAHPDEDTPRLMYADWLDEHGQPERAEFIRVQIELAPLRYRDPKRKALMERADALLKANESKWLPPNFSKHCPKGRGFEILSWDRGFPGTLRLTLSELDPAARAALDQLPLVARVEAITGFTASDDRLQALLDGIGQKTGTLFFENDWISDRKLEMILKALPRLRGLGFAASGFTAEMVDKIIEHGHASRLVYFSAQGMTPSAAKRVIQSGKFPNLVSLGVGNINQIFEVLESPSATVPSLKELLVASAPSGESRKFLSSAAFQNLRSFQIGAYTEPEAAHFAHFVEAAPNNLVSFKILNAAPPHDEIPIPASTIAMLEDNQRRLNCDRVLRALSDI